MSARYNHNLSYTFINDDIDVDIATYRNVLKDYYKAIRDLSVEGHEVRLPGGFGTLRTKRVTRSFKRHRINFQASFKRKQEIIDEGLIPQKPGKLQVRIGLCITQTTHSI